jgi:hypothetical protein
MIEKSYNIHNIVSFKIVDNRSAFGRLFSELEDEYEYFEVEEVADPDFVIYVGKFIPENRDSYSLDDIYTVKKGYLFSRDSYKLDKWKLQIAGLDDKRTTFHLSSNLFGNMHLSRFSNFFIYLKITEKGYPLVHASAVSKNNKAYLFPSSSGGGKTSLALYFVERGYQFLADNLVILKDANVLSFPSPLRMFTYNLSPRIKRKLGMRRRTSLRLKDFLYKISAGYAKIFLRLHIKDIFAASIVDTSKLNGVYLLTPGNKLHVSKLNKEQLVEHLIMNQEVEFYPYLKFMLEYSYMFPNGFVGNYFNSPRTKSKQNLEKALGENFNAFKLEVPPRYTPEVFETIYRMVEKT